MIPLIRRKSTPSELSSGLTPAMFAAEPSTLRAGWNKLWIDLYTEYDARHLEKELSIRNLIATEEGAAFFNAWAADGERHTNGFIQIMELVADGSQKDLWERLGGRLRYFSKVNDYLRDEFSPMVVIAFDEMCSCRAYAADKEFYGGLGDNRFHRWLGELIADEAAHSRNAVNIIRAAFVMPCVNSDGAGLRCESDRIAP
ncbi:hypothetical protein IVA95_04260 [Bradyrhizobium sp. 157]|uniref:hypothetical protein n=1 Tax=Bradyrhizobium sp. 157 TaxID=2782631 RepID=UPI001FFC2002|nr:hypothetical protein [Bradyrhizobium sp. 157]MCK1636820.1 hypothetical protein [Bradyrhizobium sp. 157]